MYKCALALALQSALGLRDHIRLPLAQSERSVRLFIQVLFLVLITAPLFADGKETIVRPLQIPGDSRFDYYTDLLRAALDITRDTHGPFTWEAWPEDRSSLRQAELLEQGRVLNVVYSAWDPHLSDASIIVKPHIRKGVNGYRVPIIRKADLDRFRVIKIADGLKGVRAGQGRGWPDALVYHQNQLPIVDIAEFPRLFPMLLAGRFDYFPLGIVEAQKILDDCGAICEPLTIAPNLLIRYDLAIYFHVSRKEPGLAKRLEAGLERLIASGGFETLWRDHHAQVIEALNIESRTRLAFPFNSGQPFPLDPRPELWVDK